MPRVFERSVYLGRRLHARVLGARGGRVAINRRFRAASTLLKRLESEEIAPLRLSEVRDT